MITDLERIMGEHPADSEKDQLDIPRTHKAVTGTTNPLYIFPGGLKQLPLLKKQYLPIATATLAPPPAVLPAPLPAVLPAADAELEDNVRSKSPRMMTSACMTVLPPRMMFVVPRIWDLRETLLPVSWEVVSFVLQVMGGATGRGIARTVSMYSPLGALRDMASTLAERN